MWSTQNSLFSQEKSHLHQYNEKTESGQGELPRGSALMACPWPAWALQHPYDSASLPKLRSESPLITHSFQIITLNPSSDSIERTHTYTGRHAYPTLSTNSSTHEGSYPGMQVDA